MNISKREFEREEMMASLKFFFILRKVMRVEMNIDSKSF